MRALAGLLAIAMLCIALAGSMGAIYVSAHQHEMADAFEIATAD